MHRECTKLTSKTTGDILEIKTQDKYEIITKLIHRFKVFRAKRNIDKVPAIEITKMGGLRCDAIECDWEDMSIRVEDYAEYVNYRCPKCGENVFTEKDYKVWMFLMKLIKIINFILPKRKVDNIKNVSTMTIEFGNGELNTKIEKSND